MFLMLTKGVVQSLRSKTGVQVTNTIQQAMHEVARKRSVGERLGRRADSLRRGVQLLRAPRRRLRRLSAGPSRAGSKTSCCVVFTSLGSCVCFDVAGYTLAFSPELINIGEQVNSVENIEQESIEAVGPRGFWFACGGLGALGRPRGHPRGVRRGARPRFFERGPEG